MSSRRKFIATSATAALAASMLPTVGREEGGGAEPESVEVGSVEAGSGNPVDSARALRRARSRAAIGQSVPIPES